MTEPRPAYRIVHATQGTLKVLGETDASDAPITALSPYAAKLLAEHATGELLLIEQATNEVVARRDLWFEAESS